VKIIAGAFTVVSVFFGVASATFEVVSKTCRVVSTMSEVALVTAEEEASSSAALRTLQDMREQMNRGLGAYCRRTRGPVEQRRRRPRGQGGRRDESG
jgi:hypothetical protein